MPEELTGLVEAPVSKGSINSEGSQRVRETFSRQRGERKEVEGNSLNRVG